MAGEAVGEVAGGVLRSFNARIQKIKELLDSSDIVFRTFRFGYNQALRAVVIFVDGLVDKEIIEESIIGPLLRSELRKPLLGSPIARLEDILPAAQTTVADDLETVVTEVLRGQSAVLISCASGTLLVDTKGWKDRSVEQPNTELSILGAQDSFTETLLVNLSLIRRRIVSRSLKVVTRPVGRQTSSQVSIVYLEDKAPKNLVRRIQEALSQLDADAVLEGQYIIEQLEGRRVSPFPLAQRTDRPDKTAASLLEGRVAIVVDGAPHVVLAPATILSLEQGAEDYYHSAAVAVFLRVLRLIGVIVAVFGPGLYVALVSVNVEVIPTSLALAIAGTREGIPYPAYIEALFLLVLLELLIEAALRLPRPIATTVTIVGGLIIGDAAVRANLVSEIMIIVVALTAIGTFTSVSYSLSYAWRLWKYAVLAVSAFLGLFGLLTSAFILLGYLASLESFGVSYLSPIAPLNLKSLWRDSILRQPWWAGLSETNPAWRDELNDP